MSLKNNQIEEAFNVKYWLNAILNNKYFYMISLILALMLAYVYNKITPTTYQVNSVIGPIENRQSTLLELNSAYSNRPGGMGESMNLENEMNSLRSFTLVSETVKELGLEITYYQQPIQFLNSKAFRHLSKPHINYRANTYSVKMDKSHPQTLNARFYIDILSDSTYRLTISEDEATIYNYVDNKVFDTNVVLEKDTVAKFNETITSRYYKFSVTLNKDLFSKQQHNSEQITFFKFNHMDAIARSYLGKMIITPISLRSTLININFQGDNLDLTVDFLNKYLQAYLNKNLSKKNNVAFNTINFIDQQLSEISDSLIKSESELRDYRAVNQVTDLNYQGQQAINQLSELNNEISTVNVQENYYNYVLDYFDNNQDIGGLAPPSAANVIDLNMDAMILELLDLNTERISILSNRTQKSLFLNQLEKKIEIKKQSIIDNTKNNLNALDLTKNELNYRKRKLSAEISRLPKTELNMVSMQRQFNITDAMYTFLLQKRSEAAITMASNIPDYEILEPARKITSAIVSPKRGINFLLAFFLGLFIPSVIIVLRKLLNQNITSVKEVERVLDKPILNLIYTNYHNTERVCSEFPNSKLAESFRNLRSNLFLKFKIKPLKIIMITSALPDDGKSFIAFNLAITIAAVGHKTIIIDCDFRKPSLHKKFGHNNKVGISSYMTNQAGKRDVIFDSDINNLSYASAGPVVPNASELVESGNLDDFFAFLNNEFEYIIIDNSPTGLVSDTTSLLRYDAQLLIVCRNNHTNKTIFFDVLKNYTANKVKNLDIIYNDLDMKKSRYARYNKYYS